MKSAPEKLFFVPLSALSPYLYLPLIQISASLQIHPFFSQPYLPSPLTVLFYGACTQDLRKVIRVENSEAKDLCTFIIFITILIICNFVPAINANEETGTFNHWDSLAAQTVKESACNAGDLGLIPGS